MKLLFFQNSPEAKKPFQSTRIKTKPQTSGQNWPLLRKTQVQKFKYSLHGQIKHTIGHSTQGAYKSYEEDILYPTVWTVRFKEILKGWIYLT